MKSKISKKARNTADKLAVKAAESSSPITEKVKITEWAVVPILGANEIVVKTESPWRTGVLRVNPYDAGTDSWYSLNLVPDDMARKADCYSVAQIELSEQLRKLILQISLTKMAQETASLLIDGRDDLTQEGVDALISAYELSNGFYEANTLNAGLIPSLEEYNCNINEAFCIPELKLLAAEAAKLWGDDGQASGLISGSGE